MIPCFFFKTRNHGQGDVKIWQDLMKKTRTNCSIHINQVSTPQFGHTKGMGVRQTSHPKEHGKVENHPWNSEASMDRWDMIGRLIFQIRVSLHSSWKDVLCSLHLDLLFCHTQRALVMNLRHFFGPSTLCIHGKQMWLSRSWPFTAGREPPFSTTK